MKRLFDTLLVPVTLFIFSGAGVKLVLGPNADSSTTDGNTAYQLALSTIYLICVLVILLKFPRYRSVFRKSILLWVLILWVFLSAIWSCAATLTLRRSIALLGTTIVALYLANNYDLRRLVLLLCKIFLVINFMSLVLILFFPGYGITPGYSILHGNWLGLYTQKNNLGRIATLETVTFLLAFHQFKKKSMLLGLVTSLLLLIGSDSVTSYFVAMALVFVILFLLYTPRNIVLRVFFGISMLTVLAIAFYYSFSSFSGFVDAFGRDITLTGRTSVWKIAYQMAMQRPLLGYGYNGFWLGLNGPSAYIWRSIGPFVHSHNGYLDLWLDLGLVGVVIFLVLFCQLFVKAFRNIKFSTKNGALILFPFVFCLFYFMQNLTESFILTRNNLFWLLFVYLIYSLNLIPVRYAKNK
jgi:O-antigen ligase